MIQSKHLIFQSKIPNSYSTEYRIDNPTLYFIVQLCKVSVMKKSNQIKSFVGMILIAVGVIGNSTSFAQPAAPLTRYHCVNSNTPGTTSLPANVSIDLTSFKITVYPIGLRGTRLSRTGNANETVYVAPLPGSDSKTITLMWTQTSEESPKKGLLKILQAAGLVGETDYSCDEILSKPGMSGGN